jgi:hypothetical protein
MFKTAWQLLISPFVAVVWVVMALLLYIGWGPKQVDKFCKAWADMIDMEKTARLQADLCLLILYLNLRSAVPVKASAKKFFTSIGVAAVAAALLALLITAVQILLILYAFYKGGHPG